MIPVLFSTCLCCLKWSRYVYMYIGCTFSLESPFLRNSLRNWIIAPGIFRQNDSCLIENILFVLFSMQRLYIKLNRWIVKCNTNILTVISVDIYNVMFCLDWTPFSTFIGHLNVVKPSNQHTLVHQYKPLYSTGARLVPNMYQMWVTTKANLAFCLEIIIRL